MWWIYLWFSGNVELCLHLVLQKKEPGADGICLKEKKRVILFICPEDPIIVFWRFFFWYNVLILLCTCVSFYSSQACVYSDRYDKQSFTSPMNLNILFLQYSQLWCVCLPGICIICESIVVDFADIPGGKKMPFVYHLRISHLTYWLKVTKCVLVISRI